MQDNLNSMTLEEQIGQLIVVGFEGLTPSPEIIDLIQKHHVGGVIFFSRNVESAQQVLDLTQSLQAIAREAGHRSPLFIAIDQENGMVRRFGQDVTPFPGNMALGALGSEQMAYEVALATGEELKALGINLNLAPVVDVNNNPANPVIGIRSFGEDPQRVARLGAATMKGYHEAGVIACLKHFPGHGDTAVDSHLALPTIPYGMDRLERIELQPFRYGIEQGALCIMTAHIAFPAVTHDEQLPATLSSAILHDLLRERCGFEQVIITDCLEMNAISETVGVKQGAIMALQAGADLILISHRYQRQRESIEAVRAAVLANEIAPSVIEESLQRVLKLKERFLSWDDLPAAPAASSLGSAAHLKLKEQAYNQTTTLIKNDEGLLPLQLSQEQMILVVTPESKTLSNVHDRRYAVDALAQALQERHAAVKSIAVAQQEELDQAFVQELQAAAVVIVPTVNAYTDAGLARLMQQILAVGRPTIGIAVYNPYDLAAFPQLKTYLATYEYTKPAIEAAVRVIYGEIQASGHLPVSIPGLIRLHTDEV